MQNVQEILHAKVNDALTLVRVHVDRLQHVQLLSMLLCVNVFQAIPEILSLVVQLFHLVRFSFLYIYIYFY